MLYAFVCLLAKKLQMDRLVANDPNSMHDNIFLVCVVDEEDDAFCMDGEDSWKEY